MRFTVRAETALHVGNGERLTWLDYRMHGKSVHVLDWGSILARAIETHDDAAERFAAFTDRCHDLLREGESALKKAPGNQKAQVLRNLRDQTNPDRFAADDLKDAALATEIRKGKHDRYVAEFQGGRLDRRLEILAQAKDAAGSPIVPASTLRGQLRSALLHGVLAAADESLARRVRDGAGTRKGWEHDRKGSSIGRARYLFGHDLEAAVFRAPNGGSKRTIHDDPRVDLMRFLIVSEPLRQRSAIEIVRTSPFAVQKASGEKRPVPLVPTVCEVIAPGSEFEVEISVDAKLLKGLAAAEGGGHGLLRDPFWELFARAFGLSRDAVKELGDGELEERVLSAVEVGLGGRAAALARRERAWYDRHDVSKDAPQRRFVESLAEHVGDRLPMRIGAGSGLHGVTALTAIELDAILAEPLARVLGRAGLGLRPRDRRDRAERERAARDRARSKGRGGGDREAGAGDGGADPAVDPKVLPQIRRLTMDGGGPGALLGFASLGRGTLAAEPATPLPSSARPAADRDDEGAPAPRSKPPR
ncbi:MAG: type III-A CRISPR-associated RAMP protein Csm5, partial [Planctomycetota bacterium JB042]